MRLIWAIGETDQVSYHATTRGSKSVNLYIPDEAAFPADQYTPLDFTVEMQMPQQHTTYWCTIHKTPVFTNKQHIVAVTFLYYHIYRFTKFRKLFQFLNNLLTYRWNLCYHLKKLCDIPTTSYFTGAYYQKARIPSKFLSPGLAILVTTVSVKIQHSHFYSTAPQTCTTFGVKVVSG